MLWSWILFTVMAAIAGIEIAHSLRGLVTGIVAGGLGAAAMLLGLGSTRLFMGLFLLKNPLQARASRPTLRAPSSFSSGCAS